MTIPTDALEPCPFCGKTEIRDHHIRDGRAVGCVGCGAEVHAYEPDALIAAKAKWNARAVLASPSPMVDGDRALLTDALDELYDYTISLAEDGADTACGIVANITSRIEVRLSEPVASPSPDSAARVAVDLVERAFDMGFSWAFDVSRPQTQEDSRAVGRTLYSDLFKCLDIQTDGFNSFESADAGIVDCKRIIKDALGRNALSQIAQGAGEEKADADRIAEVMADGPGCWRTCSGCYETEDGQNVHGYPYSKVFREVRGSGCSECGGLGVVWDSCDYSDIGAELAQLSEPPPPSPSLLEAAQFSIAALASLEAYEADYGQQLSDFRELGRIESWGSGSFRIRVGHIRGLANALRAAMAGLVGGHDL